MQYAPVISNAILTHPSTK